MSKVETGLFLNKVPYIKSGSGPKKAVVFFGVNALFKRLDRTDADRYARAFARLLPGDYTFYLLGYEETPPETYGLGTIVSDFEKILRTGIGKATVIGVSLGGFVALRFAAEHPELVDKLVVLCGAHRFSEQGRGKMANQFTRLREGNLHALLEENAILFRRPWYNWLMRLKLWKDRDTLGSQLKAPRSILKGYEGIFSQDFDRNREYARRVKADTLLIGGTADQFFDVEAFTEMARLIPSARAELFDHETHMLPMERARDVARVLAGFLALEEETMAQRGSVPKKKM